MTHPNTPEQDTILSATKSTEDNLMVNALAGTGKTSTLEKVEKVSKLRPILYLVFNKRNADEAKERMNGATTVKTFNALGHGIWQGAVSPRLKLETSKIYNIFKELADEVKGEAARAIWDSYEQVKFGVEMARALGYVPEDVYPNATRLINRSTLHNYLDEEPDDLVGDLIDAILRRCIKLSYDGIIDYNDQIYMPALFGGTFPQFPLTMVDEYQDLSPVNHHMIHKLVGKRRLIGVGDPHQNIYGFRGAKGGGMAEAEAKYNMTPLDLSVSFRCPEAIVRNTLWHVPNFKWFNRGGEVGCRDYYMAKDFEPNSVFICRLNAPLFALAFKLIAHGHSINLVGTEIGPRLVKTMQKLGDESLSQSAALDAITEWLELKLAKGSKTAKDMAECMKIIVKQSASLGTAVSYAEHLFKQRGAIQLMTGHKSKGLEFPLVYHLDPHVIGEGPQDRNLRYVIQTRSSDKYFEIASDTINWGD
jgi:superfamily I DNA/RNA helicase